MDYKIITTTILNTTGIYTGVYKPQYLWVSIILGIIYLKIQQKKEKQNKKNKMKKEEHEKQAKHLAQELKEQYQENTLYYLANQLKDQIIDEEEIVERNLTEIYYAELEYMIKNGEIILQEINAKMRMGKSTVAIALAQHVFKLLKKYGHQPKNAKFSMKKNIARDQQEKSKMMRNPELHHTVVVTDESNELERTGANVTTENALWKVFSDVQAARYVHSFYCSPKDTIDPNSDTLLQITSIDKKTRTTFCKLYYKFTEGGMTRILLLGHVEIYVGELIKTWEEESKQLFYKQNKNEQEEKRLQELIKNDLYTEYQYKKFEKMDLIIKEGIMRPRMLDTARITLKVVNRLKKLTRIMKITPTITRSLIKEEARKEKVVLSLVGEEDLVRDAMGVLGTYQELASLSKKRNEILKNKERKAITPEEYHYIDEELEKAQNELAIVAKNQVEELEYYKQIDEKYNKRT